MMITSKGIPFFFLSPLYSYFPAFFSCQFSWNLPFLFTHPGSSHLLSSLFPRYIYVFLSGLVSNLLLSTFVDERYSWAWAVQIVPGFSLFRANYEIAAYAFRGAYQDGRGMRPSDLRDPQNGEMRALFCLVWGNNSSAIFIWVLKFRGNTFKRKKKKKRVYVLITIKFSMYSQFVFPSARRHPRGVGHHGAAVGGALTPSPLHGAGD
jgi:hypothetical protein